MNYDYDFAILVGIFMNIFHSSAMMFATDHQSMLIVCAALGVAKGIRSVYMCIVVPSYVPLERLASASAIQLFTNGMVMMCIGPILGMHSKITHFFQPQQR